MADITITDLDADSSVAESDLFLKRTSNGADYKTTAGKIKEYVKSALINEGTGSSSFATVAQIAKASGVSLTTGTSSVLGSTTVEVFNAIATYGKNTKSNVTAILSGLEIGDLGYTKWTNSSGNYDSQFSVEIEYTYANSRGYAHTISKLKNQATYTMYMTSDNTSLDGVWQKDTDKLLSETHYQPLTLYGNNNIPLVVGNTTDKVVGTYLTSKFGDQQVTFTTLYHPEVGKKGNNMLLGAQRNTVVGSGVLTHDTFYNGNIQSKTDTNNLYLCGENEIDLYTGTVSQSNCTKSKLDKSGNLTIANNITAKGKVISTGDATANGATLVQNMYTKNSTSVYDSTKPYSLLAYKEIPISGWDNEDTKFHFHLMTLQYWLDCDLRLFFRWSPETTATDLSSKYCNIFNLTCNKNFSNIEKAFICKYTFTPKTDSVNGSLKVWLYFDDSVYNASGWTNYFSKELYGKEEHYLFNVNSPLHSDARTWTYYRSTTNVDEMEGENTITTTWANLDKTNVLNANTIGVNKLEVNNSTILSFGNGNKLQANSDGSVGFTTTTGTYNLINSSGEFVINRAKVSTTEPTIPVDGDMWFV